MKLKTSQAPRPPKWLPPAAYLDWRRKQANQARGDRMMQEGIARLYDEAAKRQNEREVA